MTKSDIGDKGARTVTNHASFTMACLPGKLDESRSTLETGVNVQIRTISAVGANDDVRVYLVGIAQWADNDQTDPEWTNLAFHDNPSEASAFAQKVHKLQLDSYRTDMDSLVFAVKNGETDIALNILNGRKFATYDQKVKMLKAAHEQANGAIEETILEMDVAL